MRPTRTVMFHGPGGPKPLVEIEAARLKDYAASMQRGRLWTEDTPEILAAVERELAARSGR